MLVNIALHLVKMMARHWCRGYLSTGLGCIRIEFRTAAEHTDLIVDQINVKSVFDVFLECNEPAFFQKRNFDLFLEIERGHNPFDGMPEHRNVFGGSIEHAMQAEWHVTTDIANTIQAEHC